MPLFSDYSLYSPFVSSYSPYSPVAFRSGLSSSSGYTSSSGANSNYGGYSGASGRTRYGPLLSTIVESGLTPSVPRRGPRSTPYVPPKSSYTPKSNYTPSSASSSYVPFSSRIPTSAYQRPMNVDTEDIDVSTPRKQRRYAADPPSETKGDSDTRSTIKRGRTVVRIHTKHLKDNPAMEKRKKMTPGERLKEKFMIRDKEGERRKKEEEEERLREAEREEVARRRRRLMCVEAPVVAQVKTVTEDLKKDLDKTPQNSESSGSDTETEDKEEVKRLTRKKKRKKNSVKKEPPVAPPRAKKAFDIIVNIDIDEPEVKKSTVKGKDRIKSVKYGGISKKMGTKKSIILPPKSAVTAVDEILTPKAPQRGRKFSADEKENPVEQAKATNSDSKWPLFKSNDAKAAANEQTRAKKIAIDKAGAAIKLGSDKTSATFGKSNANSAETKNEKGEPKKSEPFGDTMKSFSNFFLNFGKKTPEAKIIPNDANQIVQKYNNLVENKEKSTIVTANEEKIEYNELEIKLLREDSKADDDDKRKVGRGISNTDFKPKQSVKYSENKVSERLARFVEKKDFNKENFPKIVKFPAQKDTILTMGVDANIATSDAIIAAAQCEVKTKPEEELSSKTVEAQQENSAVDETTVTNNKKDTPEEKSQPHKSVFTPKEKTAPIIKPTLKVAGKKDDEKEIPVETAQQSEYKVEKNVQSSVKSENVEQPKQESAKTVAVGSVQKEISNPTISKPNSENKIAKRTDEIGTEDKRKVKLAEERVDLKSPIKKEETAYAKIGNGGKAIAKSEQVDTVCQNKEAASFLSSTDSVVDDKDSKKVLPVLPKPSENKKDDSKPITPPEKKFPWLNKKEDSNSKTVLSLNTEKIEAKEIEITEKKDLQSTQESIDKIDNKTNATTDKKFPWLAKKEPSPVLQINKNAKVDNIKKDALPALDSNRALKTETAKNVENKNSIADSPANKNFPWQVKAEIADSQVAKSPGTLVKKSDDDKVFLFDKETVEVITENDKRSTTSSGAEPKAAEANEDQKPAEASDVQLKKVPVKAIKSPKETENGNAESKLKLYAGLEIPKKIEVQPKVAECPKENEKPKADVDKVAPKVIETKKEEKSPEAVEKAGKAKGENKENTAVDKKYPWLAKKEPSPAQQQVAKNAKTDAISKDATTPLPAVQTSNVLKTEVNAAKNDDNTLKLVDTPTDKKSPENKKEIEITQEKDKVENIKKIENDLPAKNSKAPESPKKILNTPVVTTRAPESPKKPERTQKEPIKTPVKDAKTSELKAPALPPKSPKKETETLPDFNPKNDPSKQSLKILQSMANDKIDSKSQADSNIILAKDSVKQKPLILRSRSSTIKKQPKAKLALTKPPQANFPAPQKPLFMNNAFSKLQEAFNKQQQPPPQKQPVKLKKMRAHTDLSSELLDPEPSEEEKKKQIQKSQSSGGIVRGDRHTVRNMKFRTDRVSTVRHQALKMSVKEGAKQDASESDSDDDSDTETESGTDSESSGSDTETEEGQTKVDRNSTSSEDSGFGSNQNSPQASTNSAQSLDVRDASSPNPRRLSTSLSTDSESGEEGHARRYTPPARTIPRFRKYAVEDYQFLKVLGKGSFGKVLLAELKGTECYYAVKCLKKDVVLEDDDVECTLIERKVLALGTKHPYLCHLFCTFQTESHLFFVMEYLNGGDLMFHIQQSGRFEQSRACFYGAEIVSGLRFLHKKGIVYRDLKLDNILLDYEGHVRIADFGMCKLQIYLDRTADTFCGTPDYMAPEIIKGMHYNQCVDWWSFGVLLFEMLVGQSPFNGCDEDELFWSICNEQPYYPRYLSKEAQSILVLLLEKDSSKRLGTPDCPEGEVFEQPFFRSIDWGALDRKELEPPFKPRVQHALDVQYFDSAFTKEAAKLTPVDKDILNSMDQTQFHGFSYTNPNACNE